MLNPTATSQSPDRQAREGQAAVRPAVVADLLCLGLVWLLCLAFFWRLLTPDAEARMAIVLGDFTNQYYPYQAFAAAELHRGRLPLWNPYMLAGHPVLADPQSAIFYPVGVAINYLLGAGGLTLQDMGWRVAMHHLLAAAFTYLFARSLTGSRLGATVAALTFTFSGYLLSYPGLQLAILETAVWLPLVLLFILRAKRSERRWMLELSLAGACYGVAILAGHPQTALYLGYASLLYLAYSAWEARWPWRKGLVGMVCFGGAALGLSAVQLLPAAELTLLSTRARLAYEDAGHGYELSSLLGITLPGWRNERALYLGIAPLTLALLAIVQRIKGGGFWSTLALGSLLVSLGSSTPVFAILYRFLPGFAMFRNQERIAVLFALSLAILAAYGASSLARERSGGVAPARRLIPAVLLVATSVLAPFLLDVWGSGNAPADSLAGLWRGGYALPLALAAASGLTIWLAAFRPRPVPAFVYPALLVALIAGDLFVVNWGNNVAPASESTSALEACETIDFLRAQDGVFRLRIQNDEVLPANYPALHGLSHVGGDTPIRVKRVSDLLNSGPEHEWKLWHLFNVEYVMTGQTLGDGVELAFEAEDVRIYRMLYGLPRAYAVTSFYVAADADDALAQTLWPERHPGDEVVLERAPTFDTSSLAAERPQVDIIEYSPQRLVIAASGEGSSMLVVSKAHYPGWRAYLNGEPTQIYRANYAFQAVELPSGDHTVEMRFEPTPFKLGAIVSSLTVLGLLVATAAQSVRRFGYTHPAGRQR